MEYGYKYTASCTLLVLLFLSQLHFYLPVIILYLQIRIYILYILLQIVTFPVLPTSGMLWLLVSLYLFRLPQFFRDVFLNYDNVSSLCRLSACELCLNVKQYNTVVWFCMFYLLIVTSYYVLCNLTWIFVVINHIIVLCIYYHILHK